MSAWPKLRLTSTAILVSFIAAVTVDSGFLPSRPDAISSSGVSGELEIDFCGAWEQMPAVERGSALVWLPSFVVLIVQGLRNRAVPRWLASVGLICFFVMLRYQWWNLQHCHSGPSIALSLVWAVCFIAICLQEIVSRPAR
jgi:hypothetical protein